MQHLFKLIQTTMVWTPDKLFNYKGKQWTVKLFSLPLIKHLRIHIINYLIEIFIFILFFDRVIKYNGIIKKNISNINICKLNEIQNTYLPELNIFIDNIDINYYKNKAHDILLSRENIRETGFTYNLYDMLKESEKIELLKIALSSKILDNAINYFKFVPFLSGIQLAYNIPRIELSQEGSKCWHRDSNVLKEFDVFTILSKVDNESGPFCFIANNLIKNHEIIRKTKKNDYENDILWTKNRISDDEMNMYVSNESQVKLTGNSGNTVMLDATRTYHKGGFCKKNARLMFRCYYGLKGPTIKDKMYLGISTNNDYFTTIINNNKNKYNSLCHSKNKLRDNIIDIIDRIDSYTKSFKKPPAQLRKALP